MIERSIWTDFKVEERSKELAFLLKKTADDYFHQITREGVQPAPTVHLAAEGPTAYDVRYLHGGMLVACIATAAVARRRSMGLHPEDQELVSQAVDRITKQLR
jgi:hypothetical protein